MNRFGGETSGKRKGRLIMNKMNNRRQDAIRMKLLAFCFAIMMSFT